MKFERPLTLLLCLLIIIAAWIAALAGGADHQVRLASTAAITLLCGAIMLHYIRGAPRQHAAAPAARRSVPAGEAAEFRRSLFNLCAALKLGIRFCEDHPDSEPDVLIEQLQQISQHVDSFVSQVTRPVRFSPAPAWRRHYHRPRWPWRAHIRRNP